MAEQTFNVNFMNNYSDVNFSIKQVHPQGDDIPATPGETRFSTTSEDGKLIIEWYPQTLEQTSKEFGFLVDCSVAFTLSKIKTQTDEPRRLDLDSSECTIVPLPPPPSTNNVEVGIREG